jgi:hypothetical protein
MAWTDIFTGNNAGLSNAQKSLGSLAGYSSNVGEQGTNAAMDYNKGILSGDPTQVAMTLAPEIKTLGEQGQQNKNPVAQFGNRGGGMNAVMAGLDDATRAKLISLMGGLRQGAAGQLGQLGTQNLQLGQQGNMDAAKIAQMEHENMMNGLLSKGIGAGIGGLETLGLGGLGQSLGILAKPA